MPKPTSEQRPSTDSPQSVWRALNLAWELGYIIAIPAVLFGLGGAYLDRYLGTSPLCILLGFTLALLLSGIGVVRRVKQL